jgi:hypothetical protein
MNETTTNTGYYSGTIGTVSTGTTTGYHQSVLNTPLTGTVGMGCSNPSEKLTVSGTNFNQGLTLQGNSTIHYSTNQFQNNMTPKQVNVAVFTIKRDKDTNEINSTKFVKQLWVEQKNGTSIDLLVAKELGNDFDPETTVIKVLTTVSF